MKESVHVWLVAHLTNQMCCESKGNNSSNVTIPSLALVPCKLEGGDTCRESKGGNNANQYTKSHIVQVAATCQLLLYQDTILVQ